MERTNEEKEALFNEAIQKVTGVIMDIPSFIRGSVLADAELLANGSKETHARILGLVYGTIVSSAVADPHVKDPHEEGIIRGNLPVLIDLLHGFAEEKRKTDITIKNLSGALAILNGQEEGK